MIGRLAILAVAAAAAAAAGAAVWAKRQGEEDAALEAEILAQVEEGTTTEAAHEIDAGVAPDDAGDDLTSIKGIGAVSDERLRGIGVTTFAQIASWSGDDVDDYATRIKVSAERIRREDWVGQARSAVEGPSQA